MCTCDLPTCQAIPCKTLRELRATWRLIMYLREVPEYGIVTIDDVLGWIETECEILCK